MKSLVILSGGQDSTTCLFDAVNRHGAANVYTLTIDYGQRHKVEIGAAMAVVQLAGLFLDNCVCVNVPGILTSSSPLTDRSVKLEQYKDHQSLPGGLEKTFVPARNMLFLTIAANRAYAQKIDEIVIGVSQEDYGGYPDCRGMFIHQFSKALSMGLDKEITIRTPLLYKTKASTVSLALELPGCYKALAYTHTAYDGMYPPMGKDHATLLRSKGFEEAGVPDPLVVRAWCEGRMDLPGSKNYDTVRQQLPRAHFEDVFSLLARLVGAQ